MIETQDKLKLLGQMIEAARRHGQDENLAVLRAISTDIRAQLEESSRTAHKALAHQLGAAMRQKARLGYVDGGVARALVEAMIAHWPAVAQALRDAGRNEELRRTIEALEQDIRDMDATENLT